MKIIILAGGGGTRLWPLSRQDYPKQFLSFDGKASLLQKTIQRFENFREVDDIVVITSASYTHLIEKQGLSCKCHVLIEPMSKNTAPAIALAVKYIEEHLSLKEGEKILVLPSDHHISPEKPFLTALRHLDIYEALDEKIVTFGIAPTRAETGYGYVEIGNKNGPLTYDVKCFVEKPDSQKAAEFCKNGKYFWNSGMFLFESAVFWREIKEHFPNLYSKSSEGYQALFASFAELEAISIDYAVMEKSKHLLLCPLDVEWSDIGSWDSLYEILDKDANSNVKVGNVLDIDTKGSLIMGGKRLISTIGLEDILIVETQDALFMAKKGHSQKVKHLVEELRKKGQKESDNNKRKHYLWGEKRHIEEGDNFQIVHYLIAPLQELQITTRKDTTILLKVRGEGLLENKKIMRVTTLPENKTITIRNPKQIVLEVILFDLKETLPKTSKKPTPEYTK